MRRLSPRMARERDPLAARTAATLIDVVSTVALLTVSDRSGVSQDLNARLNPRLRSCPRPHPLVLRQSYPPACAALSQHSHGGREPPEAEPPEGSLRNGSLRNGSLRKGTPVVAAICDACAAGNVLERSQARRGRAHRRASAEGTLHLAPVAIVVRPFQQPFPFSIQRHCVGSFRLQALFGSVHRYFRELSSLCSGAAIDIFGNYHRCAALSCSSLNAARVACTSAAPGGCLPPHGTARDPNPGTGAAPPRQVGRTTAVLTVDIKSAETGRLLAQVATRPATRFPRAALRTE